MRSTDLVNWEQGPDALPELPDWTVPGKVWAPEVGSARRRPLPALLHDPGPDRAIQCVGVAVAGSQKAPTGPQHRPLVCEEDQGGTIDAHPFTTAAGKRYLYWKNDGNAVGVDT